MVSIADNLLSLLISFVRIFSDKLPVNISGLPLIDFDGYFSSVSYNLITSYNYITYFVPIKLLFIIIISMIWGEVILLSIKVLKYIFAQIRGSGT